MFNWKSPPEIIRIADVELVKTSVGDMEKAWWLYYRATNNCDKFTTNLILPNVMLLLLGVFFSFSYSIIVVTLLIGCVIAFTWYKWVKHRRAEAIAADYYCWMKIIINKAKVAH